MIKSRTINVAPKSKHPKHTWSQRISNFMTDVMGLIIFFSCSYILYALTVLLITTMAK